MRERSFLLPQSENCSMRSSSVLRCSAPAASAAGAQAWVKRKAASPAMASVEQAKDCCFFSANGSCLQSSELNRERHVSYVRTTKLKAARSKQSKCTYDMESASLMRR